MSAPQPARRPNPVLLAIGYVAAGGFMAAWVWTQDPQYLALALLGAVAIVVAWLTGP